MTSMNTAAMHEQSNAYTHVVKKPISFLKCVLVELPAQVLKTWVETDLPDYILRLYDFTIPRDAKLCPLQQK